MKIRFTGPFDSNMVIQTLQNLASAYNPHLRLATERVSDSLIITLAHNAPPRFYAHPHSNSSLLGRYILFSLSLSNTLTPLNLKLTDDEFSLMGINPPDVHLLEMYHDNELGITIGKNFISYAIQPGDYSSDKYSDLETLLGSVVTYLSSISVEGLTTLSVQA